MEREDTNGSSGFIHILKLCIGAPLILARQTYQSPVRRVVRCTKYICPKHHANNIGDSIC